MSVGKIKFFELKKGEEYQFVFDAGQSWLEDLVKELEQEYNEDDLSELTQGQLKAKGMYKKGVGGKFGDYFLLEGTVEGEYRTLDVQSGNAMMAKVETDLFVCCIDEENKEKFDLEEELVINIGDNEFDLFFFDGKSIDIGEIIREMVLLAKDDYPTTELPQ